MRIRGYTKQAGHNFPTDDARAGCRPGAAEANDGLRASQRRQILYEVHACGKPVVLLHGAFVTITNNETGWIDELATCQNQAT